MEVNIVKTGFLEENCYILKNNNTCLVIDPGSDYENIKKCIGSFKVLGVLITHNHFDHVGALKELLDDYKVEVYKHDNLLEKEYTIENFKFNVIFNPGHSKDSVSYYFKDEGIMFVGDFIFKDSVGRCDLDGGSIKEMKNSIDRIKKYNNIILYPGHGDKTNIDYEKENNPYF